MTEDEMARWPIIFVMGIWGERVNFDATVVKGLQLTEG